MDKDESIKGKYVTDLVVYNSHIEEEEYSLLYRMANTRSLEGAKIRVMPDHHLGKGCLIGFTMPIKDTVNPSFVGVDIGCAVSTMLTNIPINKDELPLIEEGIRKRVKFGGNYQEEAQYGINRFLSFLEEKSYEAHKNWKEAVDFIPMFKNGKSLANMLNRVGMDQDVFSHSIGTVGGGNHFVEVGDYHGNYAITIHCGSRNFGVKVCNYWEKMAKKPVRKDSNFKQSLEEFKKTVKDKTKMGEAIKQFTEERNKECCEDGFLKGDLLNGYLTDMVIAQAYAEFNHYVIQSLVMCVFKDLGYTDIKSDIWNSVHNYIDTEDRIIRKGAIRARKGDNMVVPFNMRDGIALCVGKGNEDWNCSCSHGSGRKLSRSKAKEMLSMEEFNDEMKNVYSTTVCKETLDESPMAYKDTDEIIEQIKETCEIRDFVKPLINIKGID
jgi:RNA-splicing ligase RtcB